MEQFSVPTIEEKPEPQDEGLLPELVRAQQDVAALLAEPGNLTDPEDRRTGIPTFTDFRLRFNGSTLVGPQNGPRVVERILGKRHG
jgi:hypothetical protein